MKKANKKKVRGEQERQVATVAALLKKGKWPQG